MDSITLNAHAKINLSLRVVGKRPDGYHDIVSFMQGAGLHDVVTIKKCFGNGTKYKHTCCNINGVLVYLCTSSDTMPMDKTNLVFKGVEAFVNACKEGSLPEEISVEIDKRLPVAAGIAGGSGNAAAVMLGLNALAGYPLPLRELMDAGAFVGADVPFSIFMNAHRNRGALGGLKGIEEELEVPAPLDEAPKTSAYGVRSEADVELLPSNLGSATERFACSELMREVLGEQAHRFIAEHKQAEWDAYCAQVTQWEIDRHYPVL